MFVSLRSPAKSRYKLVGMYSSMSTYPRPRHERAEYASGIPLAGPGTPLGDAAAKVSKKAKKKRRGKRQAHAEGEADAEGVVLPATEDSRVRRDPRDKPVLRVPAVPLVHKVRSEPPARSARKENVAQPGPRGPRARQVHRATPARRARQVRKVWSGLRAPLGRKEQPEFKD